MQLAAIIVSLVLTVVGVALLARAIGADLPLREARPARPGRHAAPTTPTQRTLTLVKEFLGHTRMNRWGIVGFAHWFVAIGFLTLPPTLAQAFGQLFQADWVLPIIGGFLPFELYIEFIGLMTVVGIVVLMVIRLLSLPSRAGRKSRFAGSKAWQAYFVEYVILTIGLAILVLRGLEGAIHHVEHYEAGVLRLVPAGPGLRGPERRHAAEPHLLHRDDQDRHLAHLDDRGLAQHQHGCRLAPLPRLPEHLVQAQRGRRAPRSARSSR